MFGKHWLQKPTKFVGLLTKWRMSPKTDEIMGNSGTATAVPAVPGAAPLSGNKVEFLVSNHLWKCLSPVSIKEGKSNS